MCQLASGSLLDHVCGLVCEVSCGKKVIWQNKKNWKKNLGKKDSFFFVLFSLSLWLTFPQNSSRKCCVWRTLQIEKVRVCTNYWVIFYFQHRKWSKIQFIFLLLLQIAGKRGGGRGSLTSLSLSVFFLFFVCVLVLENCSKSQNCWILSWLILLMSTRWGTREIDLINKKIEKNWFDRQKKIRKNWFRQ